MPNSGAKRTYTSSSEIYRRPNWHAWIMALSVACGPSHGWQRHRMWLVDHHMDDKGTECGLWTIIWMTKAPSVACGQSHGWQRDRMWLVDHHMDDKGTYCGLWTITWMTKAPNGACGPSYEWQRHQVLLVGHVVLVDEEEIRPLNKNQV
jgi:D-hexose-6-phosphate mutarotase